MVLAAIALSIGLGGLIGYLTRSPSTPDFTPGNIQVEHRASTPPTDAQVQLNEKLESLITESAQIPDPRSVAGFDPVVLLLRRSAPMAEGTGVRLDGEDVPPALLRALLRRLSSTDSMAPFIRQRVLHRLSSDRSEGQRLGVDLLRDLKLGEIARNPACRCVAGLYPRPDQSSSERYLFAFPIDEDSRIRWAPSWSAQPDASWRLNLAPAKEGDGQHFLLRKIEEPERPWTVHLDQAGRVQIPVPSAD